MRSSTGYSKRECDAKIEYKCVVHTNRGVVGGVGKCSKAGGRQANLVVLHCRCVCKTLCGTQSVFRSGLCMRCVSMLCLTLWKFESCRVIPKDPQYQPSPPYRRNRNHRAPRCARKMQSTRKKYIASCGSGRDICLCVVAGLRGPKAAGQSGVH